MCHALKYISARPHQVDNVTMVHMVHILLSATLRDDIHIHVTTQNIKLTFLSQPSLENVMREINFLQMYFH